eukprot:gene8977-5784_t
MLKNIAQWLIAAGEYQYLGSGFGYECLGQGWLTTNTKINASFHAPARLLQEGHVLRAARCGGNGPPHIWNAARGLWAKQAREMAAHLYVSCDPWVVDEVGM